jgi:hypothetical protein
MIRLKYFSFLLIAVLFFFSFSTWGMVSGVETIYSRGTGQLFFSFVNLYLWGMALVIAGPVPRDLVVPCSSARFFWIFNVLFALNVVAGMISGVSFFSAMSQHGVLNVLNMAVMMFVLQRSFDNEQDLDDFSRLMVVSIFGRGIFGLVRFTFFGGDPANIYANFQGIAVKLTFFDINDSLLATIAAFYAGWRLSWKGGTMRLSSRVFYALVLVLESLVVFFSYRRTAIFGFVFAAALFIALQPKSRRLPYLLIGSAVSAVAIAILLGRLQAWQRGGAGFLESLLPDVVPEKGGSFLTGRLLELRMAFGTIRDNWLLGAGTWSSFREGVLWYHFGVYDFVHSGIVHVWLKTGIVGLVLFLAGLASYVFFVQTRRSTIEPEKRGLYEAAFAGFLFSVPNLLFGTPIIEFRTMLLLGLILAIPYVVHYRRTRTGGVAQ